MIPVLFEIGPIKLYSFGLMAGLAFLCGSYLLKLEMDRRGFGEGKWNTYAITALLCGFLGAKLNFLMFSGELDDLSVNMIVSGSGLVWYGGFIGGVLGAAVVARRNLHPYGVVADAFAPALAAAYLLGRVGCFVSGDGDYGYASDVPWAMAFPNGIVPTTERVHPTPIYEVLLMIPVLWILWRVRKRPWAPYAHIGLYLILAGIERFVVEFWRRNEPGFLGITTAQQLSILAILLGLVLWGRRSTGAGEAATA